MGARIKEASPNAYRPAALYTSTIFTFSNALYLESGKIHHKTNRS